LQFDQLQQGQVGARLKSLDRYRDPSGLQTLGLDSMNWIADELQREAPALAKVLRHPADSSQPPLMVAVFTFFFRREIETNQELFQGLTNDQLRQMQETLRYEFTSLEAFLRHFSGKMELILETMQEHLKEIKKGVADANEKLDELLRRSEKLGISVSTPAEELWLKQAKAFGKKYPHLVGPDFFERLTQVELSAGYFAEAVESQVAVAEIAHSLGDRRREAEALFKQFRAACEPPGQFDVAFTALRNAIELDPQYEPFPQERYQTVRILGAGAFGTVFLVQDLDDLDDQNQPIAKAIKTFYDDLGRPYEEFSLEARLLKSLQHDQIIGVRECTRHRIRVGSGTLHRPFLVLEYFDSISLEKLLQQSGGKLPVAEALNIARQVAMGVHAAHGKKILHRDLKPGNILVRKITLDDGRTAWEVKVIDFGLAMQMGQRQTMRPVSTGPAKSLKQRAVVGTMKYAPPEQKGDPLITDPVGTYSDIYSFGKTTIEMLTGHPDGSDELEEEALGLTQELQKLLRSCVAAKVQRRPGNFDSLLKLLADYDTDPEPTPLDEVMQTWLDEWFATSALLDWVQAKPNLTWNERDWYLLTEQIEKQMSAKLGVRVTLSEAHCQQISDRLASICDRLRLEARRQQVRLEEERKVAAERAVQAAAEKARQDAADKAKLEAEEQARKQATEQARLQAEAKRLESLRELLDCTSAKGADDKTVLRHQKNWSEVLSVPVDYKLDLGGGVQMEFVLVPPGIFMMGGDQDDDEKPIHRVTLSKPFYIGKYAVTQQEYQKLIGKNPSHFSTEPQWQRHPVEQVNWHEAMEFAAKVQAKIKLNGFSKVTLPTEAQWEYACRAGTRTHYHFGDLLNGDKANCNGNYPFGPETKGNYLEKTTPVGGYAGNVLRLFDMHGNVLEWCLDGWDEKAYKAEGRIDPYVDYSNNSRRVLRGGSWGSYSRSCRSAFRGNSAPDYRVSCYGFRLALLP
jgi:formylglycine-generating enzyme required for sulfatase activity/serine/threonine protein kinase